MKINHLHLSHFRRFSDFHLPLHPQLTVLVAKNGAGKTSILDALGILLGAFLTRLPKVNGLNPKHTDFQVFPDGSKPAFMRLSAEFANGVQWDRTERRDQSKKTVNQIPEGKGLKALNGFVDSYIDSYNEGKDFELPVFIYYGSGRGVFDVPQRKRSFKKEFRRFDTFSGALESRTNFKRFAEYFYFLNDLEKDKQQELRDFDAQIPELRAIRQAIAKCLPDFSNPRVAKPAGIALDWQQGDKVKSLLIEQFSDGYRTSLAMIMDIAARMAEANPDMPDPLATSGVVMIDEVDLHLHPGWQQTILLDLMQTFPNVQFVVSTHSPQVVSSVKPECLRVLDWQNEEPQLVPIGFSEGADAQQLSPGCGNPRRHL